LAKRYLLLFIVICAAHVIVCVLTVQSYQSRDICYQLKNLCQQPRPKR